MANRLTDEEYARHAAKHSLHPHGEQPRPERVESLKQHGVNDEKSLGDHALKVMTHPDTKCFRGHEGRECYGNNDLNTIVRTNEKNPEQSTVHHNGNSDLTATQRVERSAQAEGARNGTTYEIRTGGSQALEADRIARPLEPANPYRHTAPEPERKPDQPANPYKRPGIEDDTGHSH